MERMGRATTHLCVAREEVSSARQMVHTKKVRKMKIRLRCSILALIPLCLSHTTRQGTEDRAGEDGGGTRCPPTCTGTWALMPVMTVTLTDLDTHNLATDVDVDVDGAGGELN